MTKKHFQALAAALFAQKPCSVGEAFAVWRNTCDAIADACKASNGAFDRERFIAACVRGPKAPVRKEPRGEDEIERLRRLN